MVALTTPAGCGATAFACSDDDACTRDGSAGTCEPSGHCSFPDGSCASGQRYGEHAGTASGKCVPSGDGSDDNGEEPTDPATGPHDASGMATSMGGTTEASSASAEASSGSGGAPAPDELYGPCDPLDREACAELPGGTCIAIDESNACGQTCVEHSDCPPGPEGNEASCFNVNDVSLCVIPCFGDTCPAGMHCSLAFVCLW